jgi:hypothetical protein
MSPPNRFIESFAPIFARLGIRRVRQFSRPIGSETGRPAALRPPADAEETAKIPPAVWYRIESSGAQAPW